MTNFAEHTAGLRLNINLALTDFQLVLNTEIQSRGVTALFGRSGCGKTSLLRVIAGLEQRATGQISFAGQCWLDGQWRCPAEQRRIGLVSQHDTLFAHLSVKQNLLFGYQRTPAQLRRIHPATVFQQLDLIPLLSRQVAQLSGGQKQRVALGRALLSQPQLLLLDEPFSALDLQGRQEILPYLQQLLATIEIPVVLVSHQLEDVVQLADQLILLDQGQVKAQGPLATLLHTEVALQHEAMSLLYGWQMSADNNSGLCQIELSKSFFWLPMPLQSKLLTQPDVAYIDTPQQTKPCRLRIRARDVSVSLQPLQQSSIQIQLPAHVSHWHATAHPAVLLLMLELADGQQLAAQVSRLALEQLALTEGKPLFANIKAAALHE